MDDMAETGSQQDTESFQVALSDFIKVGKVLGIGTEDPEGYFQKKKNKVFAKKDVNEALVEKLIAERTQAREEKNWSRADEIRDQLAAMNVVLEDRPKGTVWKTKD
jgi:cysteinyl-tRNA synthetase